MLATRRSQALALGTKSRECSVLSGRLGFEARRARCAPATLLDFRETQQTPGRNSDQPTTFIGRSISDDR